MQVEKTPAVIEWHEAGKLCRALWRSENGTPPPKKVVIADDTLKADAAYRLACEGTAFLWRGDFQNARQLLVAMSRRIDRKPRKPVLSKAEGYALSLVEGPVPSLGQATPAVPGAAFNLHRQAQAQRARVLAMILLPLDAGYVIPLRRAPDVALACAEVYGKADGASVVSLREVLGLIGAHEWRKKGVEVAALGACIHPYYGVYSPVRGEYLELVNSAPLPGTELAFDIGTGTGVLAALLAKRGVRHVVATDQDARAGMRARQHGAIGICAASGGRASRSFSRRPRAAHRVQSTLDTGTSEFRHRVRDL